MNILESLSPELRFVADTARIIQDNEEVVQSAYSSTLQGLQPSEEAGKIEED